MNNKTATRHAFFFSLLSKSSPVAQERNDNDIPLEGDDTLFPFAKTSASGVDVEHFIFPLLSPGDDLGICAKP